VSAAYYDPFTQDAKKLKTIGLGRFYGASDYTIKRVVYGLIERSKLIVLLCVQFSTGPLFFLIFSRCFCFFFPKFSFPLRERLRCKTKLQRWCQLLDADRKQGSAMEEPQRTSRFSRPGLWEVYHPVSSQWYLDGVKTRGRIANGVWIVLKSCCIHNISPWTKVYLSSAGSITSVPKTKYRSKTGSTVHTPKYILQIRGIAGSMLF
jgi:hypothetical protein